MSSIRGELTLPLGSSTELPWRWVGNEIVVLEPESGRTHCLHAAAARVWLQCSSGTATVEEVISRIAAESGLHLSEAAVMEAVAQLCEAGLMQEPETKLWTRRGFLIRAGIGAAAAVGGSLLVESFTPAFAATGTIVSSGPTSSLQTATPTIPASATTLTITAQGAAGFGGNGSGVLGAGGAGGVVTCTVALSALQGGHTPIIEYYVGAIPSGTDLGGAGGAASAGPGGTGAAATGGGYGGGGGGATGVWVGSSNVGTGSGTLLVIAGGGGGGGFASSGGLAGAGGPACSGGAAAGGSGGAGGKGAGGGGGSGGTGGGVTSGGNTSAGTAGGNYSSDYSAAGGSGAAGTGRAGGASGGGGAGYGGGGGGTVDNPSGDAGGGGAGGSIGEGGTGVVTTVSYAPAGAAQTGSLTITYS